MIIPKDDLPTPVEAEEVIAVIVEEEVADPTVEVVTRVERSLRGGMIEERGILVRGMSIGIVIGTGIGMVIDLGMREIGVGRGGERIIIVVVGEVGVDLLLGGEGVTLLAVLELGRRVGRVEIRFFFFWLLSFLVVPRWGK